MEPAPVNDSLVSTEEVKVTAGTWRNWFSRLVDLLGRTPERSTGTAAPTTTPTKIGNIFVDTANAKVYVATGTASSSDWTVVN